MKYFDKKHEEAIRKYVESDDEEERRRLFREVIRPVFEVLIDNVVMAYKFTSLPNIDYMKDDCLSWIATIIDKFNPGKNTKAFSYFTVCTKNWFRQKAKKVNKKLKREETLEGIPPHIEEEDLVVEHEYEVERLESDFFKFLMKDMKTWDEGRRGRLLGDNDLKVVKAVRILFENIDDVEIFNKKAIYIHLREITDLNTKQITRSLNKLCKRYERLKKAYRDGRVEKYYEFVKND